MGGIFFDSMKAEAYATPIPELAAAKARGEFHPELGGRHVAPVRGRALAVAGYEFRHMDY